MLRGSASIVSLAMRGVDPEALGAATAVPLVVALMQYQWGCADLVKTCCQPAMTAGGGELSCSCTWM
jgi:hypothetical protein